MNAKIRVAAISLALSALTWLVLLLVRPSLDPARIRPLALLIGAWLAFITAAWLLRKVPLRSAVALILLGGLAVQLAALSSPPSTSNDLYRYIWDGRVQAAGIDPYAYVPTASQLAGLRTEFLFHPGAEYCISQSYVASHPAADLTAGCTRINRPTVPTIYPPVAEAYFLAVHYLPGSDDSTTPIQSAAAGAALLTTVLLLFGLRRIGRDARTAALWSWCPTVAPGGRQQRARGRGRRRDRRGRAAGAGSARTTRRTVLGGVLLGLAIATKVTPVLTVPAVLRRRWLTVSLAMGGAIVAVYIPHVAAVGSKVIGFLPGYLQQNGYDSGQRFGIIGLFVTGWLAMLAAVLILGAVALAVLLYTNPDRPWRGAVVMTAAALAVATPAYQWYALLLVMLVALDGEPEWLAFAAGAYYYAEPGLGRAYVIPHRLHAAVAYGIPVLIVAAGWLVRQALARRGAARAVPVLADPVPGPVGWVSPADPVSAAGSHAVLVADEEHAFGEVRV